MGAWQCGQGKRNGLAAPGLICLMGAGAAACLGAAAGAGRAGPLAGATGGFAAGPAPGIGLGAVPGADLPAGLMAALPSTGAGTGVWPLQAGQSVSPPIWLGQARTGPPQSVQPKRTASTIIRVGTMASWWGVAPGAAGAFG